MKTEPKLSAVPLLRPKPDDGTELRLDDKVTLEAHVVLRYTVERQHYLFCMEHGAMPDDEQMAQIDTLSFLNNEISIEDIVQWGHIDHISIEPVKESK